MYERDERAAEKRGGGVRIRSNWYCVLSFSDGCRVVRGGIAGRYRGREEYLTRRLENKEVREGYETKLDGRTTRSSIDSIDIPGEYRFYKNYPRMSAG